MSRFLRKIVVSTEFHIGNRANLDNIIENSPKTAGNTVFSGKSGAGSFAVLFLAGILNDRGTVLISRLQTVEHDVIAAVQRAIDTADGRRAGAGCGNNVAVNVMFAQHLCDLKTLGHGLEFQNGAEIVKERTAFLLGFQTKDRLIQLFNG